MKNPPCFRSKCAAAYVMHPELAVWIDMYFLGTAYENQELQLYREAGADDVALEVFAMLKSVHRAWQDEKARKPAQ